MTSFGADNASLNEARASLDKWVETRQVISKTRGDWQSDKEMLEQTVQLLERELKAVDEQLGKIGTGTTQVETERKLAAASLKDSQEGLETARKFATEFEAQLAKRIPLLPAPLQDVLKPHLNRLPNTAGAATTTMPATERLQVVVGILNELDKFNNAVSIFSEKRKNEKSEEVAVQSVYVGLGAAYFVDDTGSLAGTGTPGAAGWEWTLRKELAPAIKEVIRIYRNEQPARFVSLPATIK